MPEKILIAWDGSDDAREAVRQAGLLFRGRPAVVVNVWQSTAGLLLHSDLDSLTGAMQDVAAEVDGADREAAKRAASEGCDAARQAGLEAVPLCVEGKARAWPALLEVADDEDAATIVVGSRGLSGVKSALLGSVSNGLLHHSRRPVLVAPPPDRSLDSSDGPLLIGYDGSDDARRAVERCGALFAGREALVVTVWRSVRDSAAAAAMGAPAGVAHAGAERLDAEVKAAAESDAGAGADLARQVGLNATAVAQQSRGNVWATLTELAYERRPVAIALGSHGRSALGRVVIGSTSQGVAHHSPVPLLVVPPPAG